MYEIYAYMKQTGNRLVGYVVPKASAEQVYGALYWYGGIGKVSYVKSKYAVPKVWADQWLPVWYIHGPTEWGRFKAPYNKIVVDALTQYFRKWRAANKYLYPVATTTDLSDRARLDQAARYAAQAKQNEAAVCSPRKPYYDSSGEWMGCK